MAGADDSTGTASEGRLDELIPALAFGLDDPRFDAAARRYDGAPNRLRALRRARGSAALTENPA